MDTLTPAQRSWNMSQIRCRDTKPERVVRSVLHRIGARFRLHRKDLPGCPDIVLPKYRLAVLVHGCFWHRHPGCKYAYTPKSRVEFWHGKFEATVKRDQKTYRRLRALGWAVSVIWECETRDAEKLAATLKAMLLDQTIGRSSERVSKA